MNTISKSRLKAEMLSVFRQLERTNGELVVTDRGRAVLKICSLVPPKARVESVFADVTGKVVYHEDIMAPTSGEWPGM
jgi:antitoxin (DNA-binding transcriptional repressor) of toxin-antitoxin stability system